MLLCQQQISVYCSLRFRKTLCDNAYMAKGKEADARKIWAIKSGVNGFFDMVRKTYSERVEAMRGKILLSIIIFISPRSHY